MNRYVTFLSLSLCIHFSAHTQRVTLIEVLPELNSQTASFWNQATMQHDIIGSDFRGKKEIGNASAERFEGLGPAPDFWFPIGIHKKTIGGELTDMYIFDLGDDHDHNLNIIPTLDFNNDFKYSIQVATNRMEGNDPLVDAAFESKSGCKKEDFENFLVKEMQLEIDLHNSNAKSYFSKGKPHAPRVRQGSKRGDIVFAYGPWVSDAGHCFKPEIHPAEQIWWKKDISDNEKVYYLLLTSDQSDRFDEVTEFDVEEILGKNRYLKEVWAPRPLTGVFAISFAIKPRQEIIHLNLSVLGRDNLTSTYNDGKINYLVYKKDTIAIVAEPPGLDNLKITFEKLSGGINDGATNMQTIMGYIVIEAKVGKPKTITSDSKGGYVFLRATKKISLKKLAYNKSGSQNLN